jgi:S1-C subfamily serine protease
VIDSINGQPISNPSDVAGVLAGLKPGQTVPVQITKPDGSQSTVKVALGEYPAGSS